MMFKSLSCFLLAALLPFAAIGQEYGKLELKPYQKQWEKGRLTISDFQGRPPKNTDQQSALDYQLGYLPEKSYKDDTTIFWLHTYSYMDQYRSWFRTGEKDETLLKYNQAVFNLIEVHDRRLQSELYRIRNISQAKPILNRLSDQLDFEISRFAEQTRNGQDAIGVQQYLVYTENQLLTIPKEEWPPLRRSKISYAVNGGIGYSASSGDIGRYFRNPMNLVAGVDVGYKKAALLLNATLGFTETNQAFTRLQTQYWETNLNSKMTLLEASIGYRVWDKAKLRVQPFAGWSWVEFAANDRIEVYKENELADHSFSAGLVADYKLRHRINLVPGFLGIREKAETSFRTRLSFSPATYAGLRKSNVFTIATTLNFSGRILRIK
ncbi:hypothetical protein [Adhaeribacter soli]|uniref:Outer membrane beta-barrel protein n=1 Tax=Adhaeribacter soli TaxID=2607655 RepID=A0A5N1ILS1_9BACT|nr:hypothetical protein [Adhaeribacter soli]KAA9327417.1 hypothetical protein F0P94_16005 [Adhaeribacter soli]